MAQAAEQDDVRRELLEMLISTVEADRFPSVTMMNLIEQLLASPDERSVYIQVLMDKIRGERYPSLPMMRRILALS